VTLVSASQAVARDAGVTPHIENAGQCARVCARPEVGACRSLSVRWRAAFLNRQRSTGLPI
jgi:hypothetical protein